MELTNRIHTCLDEHDAKEDYYQALTNRVCCSLIGLGFRLLFDDSMTKKARLKELQRLLSTDYYHENLIKMDSSTLPTHWKVFFWAARNKYVHILAKLYFAMNYLRRVR